MHLELAVENTLRKSEARCDVRFGGHFAVQSPCPAYADFRRDPLTVALYALTDMEYPLLGPIRIKNFDHFLVDAYQQMQARGEPAIVGYGK